MDERAFYATPAPMTDLDAPAQLFDALPDDPVALANVVQGLIVHEFWAQSYDVAIPAERANEVERRSAREILDAVVALDDRPLIHPRPPDRRLFGNCRMFSTFACALLRRAGVPARARCGFGTYFEPGKFIDHWIVEYHDGARWVQLDAQLDVIQRAALGIDWDVTDMPTGQFVSGGEAWQRCRAGDDDPQQFGILDMWGMWFIRGNAIRDLASLNKVEVLPWDGWAAMDTSGDALVDEIAAVTTSSDTQAVRAFYETHDALHVPRVVVSYRLNEEVTLPV